MSGKDGLTKSMKVIFNLANPAHYNIWDLGAGMAMWMETNETQKTDVYFVFPNVIVKDGDISQSGVLIKLCDGCMISWDGSLLHHCTSV